MYLVDSISTPNSDLEYIDVIADGIINASGELKDTSREPDGIVWIGKSSNGLDLFATADEGAMNGGTAASLSLLQIGLHFEKRCRGFDHFPWSISRKLEDLLEGMMADLTRVEVILAKDRHVIHSPRNKVVPVEVDAYCHWTRLRIG
jgi:hypothetical protein